MDNLIREAAKLFVERQIAAISMLQRELGVTYKRASLIMEQLEEIGVVSPVDGKKRTVLITDLSTIKALDRRAYIKNVLNEYSGHLKESLAVFENDMKQMDNLSDEQMERIDSQWFHINNALDEGIWMFSEGTGRLDDEIKGKD